MSFIYNFSGFHSGVVEVFLPLWCDSVTSEKKEVYFRSAVLKIYNLYCSLKQEKSSLVCTEQCTKLSVSIVTNQDEPPFTHWPFTCVRNDGAVNEYW